MFSIASRFKAGYPAFAVVALFAVISIEPIVGIADEPAPSATQIDKTAQPASAAQTTKSAQPDTATPSVEGAADEGPMTVQGKSESQAARGDQADKSTPAEKKMDAAEEKKPEQEKKPGTIGEPLAPGMMTLVHDEIVAGIKRRGITDQFARFQSYAISKVNGSAGRYTGSELTGNCRLKWYDHMMRNFLTAPAEAEQFTRQLHTVVCNDRDGLSQVLSIASAKMDIGTWKAPQPLTVTSPEQALEVIKQALTTAQVSYCAALAPLNKSEIQQLQTYLVPVLCTQNNVGHTLNDRGTGRLLCDLMEKMDRGALYAAAEALAPITDVQFLEQLKSLPDNGSVRVAGVSGNVAARIDTPSGAIVIGGKGSKTYQLDQMRDVAVVIDLGENNTYYEGSVGPDRPVLVVINLGGHNTFRGSRPGIQGAAVLGVSMLLNLGGNNTYEAQDVAQGSALGGVGVLIDYAGNNRYRGIRRVQGQAIGGLGVLIGRGGKNDYHAAMWAQGFGGPLGFRTVGERHRRQPLLLRRHVARFLSGNPRLRRLGPGRRRRHPAGGRRRHRRDPRRRRRERLRVRLPLAWRRILVRPGLRPRFRRQHATPDHADGLQRRPAHPAQFPAVRLRLGLPLCDGLLLRRRRRQHLRRHHHGHRHGLGLLDGRAVRLRPRQRPLQGRPAGSPRAPAPRWASASSSTTAATTCTKATARDTRRPASPITPCRPAAATSAS